MEVASCITLEPGDNRWVVKVSPPRRGTDAKTRYLVTCIVKVATYPLRVTLRLACLQQAVERYPPS